MGKQKKYWRKYLFEFLSIFFAVTLAFALNRWNEDRKDELSETKILMEIKNGLDLDREDLLTNTGGHKSVINACQYFRNVVENKAFNQNSISENYRFLFRDYISIQNRSGYESLKSQGLELISNDSLRVDIISLYDVHFEIIEKLEETYNEAQLFQNYFTPVNDLLVEYFSFDSTGVLNEIQTPLNLSKREKNVLMTMLWKVESNTKFTQGLYNVVIEIVDELIEDIEKEIQLKS